MNSLTIVHSFAPAPYGGLEQVVQALAREQVGRGHHVTAVAVLDADAPRHPVLDALRDGGVTVEEHRLPSRAYISERRAVGALCDTLRPDVVHTHGYRADVLHGGPARRRGIPLITTVHGFTGGGWKNRFYEWLQTKAYRFYDAVVAVSRPLAKELVDRGVPEPRIRCIPNAWIDDMELEDRDRARKKLRLDRDAIWAGYVGRTDREKGADLFLVDSRVRGVVIGDGGLLSQLEARARAPDLEGRVRFAGVVRGAGRYMRALDIFVLSSRTEGTPIALLEAVSAGIPVVATRVGGVPDVVSEAEAVLVDPERPDDIAAAIESVLEDPGAARLRADQARSRLLEEFSPGEWIAKYDEVYRMALSRDRGI